MLKFNGSQVKIRLRGSESSVNLAPSCAELWVSETANSIMITCDIIVDSLMSLGQECYLIIDGRHVGWTNYIHYGTAQSSNATSSSFQFRKIEDKRTQFSEAVRQYKGDN
jgi:hypothetical protein